MLSYQHIYHAGNLADVQKHALLAVALDYLTRKDKPLSYLETHAGRGLYHLDAAEAVRTGEARVGIGRVEEAEWFVSGHPIMRVLAAVRADHGGAAYPGSPLVAAHLLRPGDVMHLAEMHPQENAALEQTMAGFPARVYRRDGFEMAQSLLPPDPRRGMMLIDPSYEVKSDYDRMPAVIAQLHRKWNVGVIALWYPILTDERHKVMLAALERQGLPKVLRHEVRFAPAREGHRMVGSGMFVINTPFGLSAEATRLSGLFAQL
ncbi:23S rRNA (adenine(2030)-N(6))-methyltransferase RlmJ [Ruegeria sp. 1NDH52C]|uniref:Ribosomal RNA large subunit methyltransferase J n=1 Tax=Ruegeria alba TaxID=2916756 RepID=A0ABS9NTA8_9RHOB|nr:23S rRNA (adenine(2030)-N(6))-methyltransferase RlmJ [Ruegeria alba]MCE8520637.1 23S rRNA (adenine(2030)-N(6))-methyltransferase RlmJ [Ruegeria pomeroyi]MCG6557442.1 23S rRNA (adenine(2030)-N(6))-methyltransferase RlmJ [Ruegeria alba]